ncbi:MAG: carboxypeptidase-like regulatory domain-containing protein [Syntrophobacteraceae bacterium]
MQKKTFRRVAFVFFAWFVIAALGPCTLTHKFGPYHGRVTDENGAPLEGAIVFSAYYTEMYTLAGFTSHFVDAQETFTDAKGEFTLPAFRAWRFRFPQRWDPMNTVRIFKPGYEVFPKYTIPDKQYIDIALRQLSTREERINNLDDIYPGYIPEEKFINLRRLRDIERDSLGLR